MGLHYWIRDSSEKTSKMNFKVLFIIALVFTSANGQGLFGRIARGVRNAVDQVRDRVDDARDRINDAANQIRGGVNNAVNQVRDRVDDVNDRIQDVGDNIRDGVQDVADRIRDLLNRNRNGRIQPVPLPIITPTPGPNPTPTPTPTPGPVTPLPSPIIPMPGKDGKSMKKDFSFSPIVKVPHHHNFFCSSSHSSCHASAHASACSSPSSFFWGPSKFSTPTWTKKTDDKKNPVTPPTVGINPVRPVPDFFNTVRRAGGAGGIRDDIDFQIRR